MKTLLLALLLPGCSLMFESIEAQDIGPDGSMNAPDANPSAPDADPSAPDALALNTSWLGTYSIMFEVVAVCSVSVFVADTLDITPEGLTFRSVSCPTHTDTFTEAVATDENTLSVDDLELWNCEKTVRYAVASFVLTFVDGEGFAYVQANQYIPPQQNIICAGGFTLNATK